LLGLAENINVDTNAVDRTPSSRVGGSLRVIREIFHHEGRLAAFYRGLMPNIIGNSSSWALYFLFYGNIKYIIEDWRLRGTQNGGQQQQQRELLTSSDYFIASGSAGTCWRVLWPPQPKLEPSN
jgi:solute carrier family 25 folate transporter 32